MIPTIEAPQQSVLQTSAYFTDTDTSIATRQQPVARAAIDRATYVFEYHNNWVSAVDKRTRGWLVTYIVIYSSICRIMTSLLQS